MNLAHLKSAALWLLGALAMAASLGLAWQYSKRKAEQARQARADADQSARVARELAEGEKRYAERTNRKIERGYFTDPDRDDVDGM